jgi:hypothetical protein
MVYNREKNEFVLSALGSKRVAGCLGRLSVPGIRCFLGLNDRGVTDAND